MNSFFKYQQDYADAEFLDSVGLNKFIQAEREKALKSYNKNDDIVYCAICGEPLKKGSISYFEGYHIDNCI